MDSVKELGWGTLFDVSVAATSDYRKGFRRFHVIGLVGSTTLAAVAIASLVAVALQHGLQDQPVASWVVYGASVGGMVVLALIALMNAPGAARVEVGALGVRLTYPNGGTKTFSWTDRRARVTLYEFPAILASGRPFPFSRFWLATWFPQSNPLTREAFDAILGSARAAGLNVIRSKSSFGTPRLVFRISGDKSARSVPPSTDSA